MNTILKRVFSLMLCLVLMVGILPVGAFASESGETAAAETATEPSQPSPVETEAPSESAEAAEPSAEVTEPSSEATEPSTEATEPSTEATEPAVIAVTGIALDVTELKVGVGELPMTLTATVLPGDAADKTVTWTSSEPGVASVDENGVVTFGYMGEAVITAACGEFSANCTVTVGEGEQTGYAGDGVIVIAASDYQRSDSGTIMTSIMNQIKEDYRTVYGVLMGGDYDAGSVNTTVSHIENVDNTISGVFPEIASQNRVYIQGNHENFAGLKPDGTNLMTTKHNCDTAYYGVYAINHDDFPWSGSSSELVGATASALGEYLDAKAEEGYSKPIFVMSHLPLHATTRGDNRYARLIFDKLEAAGEAGLNIIFLCGHNHSGGYDQYLGNGAVYLPVGSSLTVVDGKSGTYTDDSISFTYMNYGYLGKISGSACTHQTMTAFEITDDQVSVKRYDEDGAHKLKVSGVASGSYAANTDEIGTEGAVIELKQFEPDAALTGITVTAPTKTAYVVGDELDTTGMVVTASYDNGSSKDVTGYEVSADLSTAGIKTVTVTYKDQTATFEITVYAPVTDEKTGVTVAAPGISGLTVTKITEDVPADSDYGAYVSYDITPVGDFSGAATVTVPVPASFDAGKPVMVLDGNSVLSTTTIKNGTVTFTATHFSVYAVAQAAESALEWKEIPGNAIYTLDTNGVSEGEYLIVNTGSDGSGQALRNNDGSPASTQVTITNQQITTGDTDIVWAINHDNQISNGSTYIYLSSYRKAVLGEARELEISNQNNGAYRISRRSYYLSYNNGWVGSSSRANVYLFEKTGITVGGYAAMTGTTVYTVVTNTTTAEALEAQIRNNLIVYTASDANGTGAAVITDYTLSGTCDPAAEGTYTYTVTYGGVSLGTATVNVVNKEIEEIVLNSDSGSVNKGASSVAITGASLTVKYKDGTSSDPIDVTVGMLTDADGNKVSTSTVGTITDLYVNYNGQKFPFTLTVNPKSGNNYPNYPDPGAVKVNKTATGIDFQASGVATVELSASGIPMNEGVDVVIVLDTSSSMSSYNQYPDENGTEMYRIELLRPAVNNLIQQMKTKREDGSDPDIDIAILTFNGNTVKADTNEIGGAGSRGTNYGIKTGDGTISGAWEAIKDIDSNWADDTTNHTPTGSGTNYDYGLQTAYDLLAQKKADSGSERQQFVLFLSDGSPSQYNGAESNDGVSEYVNWIRGNYDNTDTDTSNDIPSIENKEFYTGYNNNNGQLHRSAEALKAANTDTVEIIRFDSSGDGTLEPVEGLGATVYSIGLLLEDGSARTEEDQITVLKTIASDESRFYNIDSVNDLSGAFSTFAQEVLLAATNARFEDQMGAMYDLQLTPVDYLPTGETTNYSTINPQIEVRSYEIWTRAEYEADTITDPDLIGTRKTNEDGSYKYTTLENITFQYQNNGTNNYTLNGATSDQLESTNILSDGVVRGKYFYYNTTSEAVTVDGITVGAETFYWKLGDIKTTELAIRYNVYLTGALDGHREAGSYDTNQSAILYYDNYLGNACKKEAVSPTMAWKGAVVRYAFYLVDASSGKPVNNEGTEVPFAQRVVIVNPTDYAYINLFSSDAFDSKEVVAGHVLPEGYWLYDESASYHITVNGNGTGQWTITGDSSLNNPDSTYVTGYDGDKYTYEDSKNVTGHEYTHTTVWFAVKWEPRAVADTVVVDYGLPVDIHVLTNDMFGKYGKLLGVTAGDITGTASKAQNSAADASAEGNFGTAEVNVPTSGYTEENSVIRYTMKNMQMTAPDVFTYSIQYANPVESKNDGFYYGKLSVIPATTIYYEDTFLNLTSYSKDDNDWVKDVQTKWSQTVSTDIQTQDEDRPGDINFAFDTVIDANNVYGYDSAYETMSTHSLNNAAKITVNANTYGTAEFTFYGTGFDVISMTSNTTGTITVMVKDESGAVVKTNVVDTYYGMNKDGTLSVNNPDAIYQVPVMKIGGLDYGKYTVTITAAHNSFFDHNKDGSYDLYLDAIRIYDPTGNLDETTNKAYIADGEAWPVYEELRNNIIASEGVTTTTDEDGNVTVTFPTEDTFQKGAIFIDCNDEVNSIADYVSYGPNNELYLANGQAIAFNVTMDDTVADVQLGIKAANGNTVTYEINRDSYTVKTTTDMYYSILDYAKGTGPVVIKNVSGGILSLTNIKVTHTSAPTSESGISLLSMDGESAGAALMMLRRAPVVEEEEIPETTVPETTVPEETEPEKTEPSEPDNTQLKAAVEAARKLKEKDYTKESYAAVKAARKAAEKVLRDRKATQAEIDEALAELTEALEALETKVSAAKPGKDEKPGKNEKPGRNDPENKNNPNSNKNNTTNEQQEEHIIVQIAKLLFGWLFT